MQADQNYHTKVTDTVWCIESMTIFPFAIKHFLCYIIVESNFIELVMQLNFGMTHFALLSSTIAK